MLAATTSSRKQPLISNKAATALWGTACTSTADPPSSATDHGTMSAQIKLLAASVVLWFEPDGYLLAVICRKPVRREELNARIELHTAMKTDASWLKSLMNGSTSQDTEAMQLLQAIMPQKIIAKIQVQDVLVCRLAMPHALSLHACAWGCILDASSNTTT